MSSDIQTHIFTGLRPSSCTQSAGSMCGHMWVRVGWVKEPLAKRVEAAPRAPERLNKNSEGKARRSDIRVPAYMHIQTHDKPVCVCVCVRVSQAAHMVWPACSHVLQNVTRTPNPTLLVSASLRSLAKRVFLSCCLAPHRALRWFPVKNLNATATPWKAQRWEITLLRSSAISPSCRIHVPAAS